MIQHQTQIRVRYSETDKMGYAYYGHYAAYFEVARVELIREFGIAYKELEDRGYLLPVLDYYCKFIRPAFYDDLLTVEVTIPKKPSTRILFEYQTFNQEGTLLNKGYTTLVFVGKDDGRPCSPPDYFMEKVMPYFSE